MVNKSRKKIESMFDEIAPSYDRLNHLFTLNIDRRWRRKIVTDLSERDVLPKIILDLASGTGDLTAELLKLNPDKIYSSDISGNMLELQRKKIPDKRLEVIQADASDLPFENKYFDIITIGFGIRNFEHLPDSLAEIRRVLKPEGLLVILEMFRSGGLKSRLFNIYFGKVMPLIGNMLSKSKYAYSYLFESVDSFLSVKDFILICDDAGFRKEYSVNNF
ncbi:MAG: ubiquinone/menaquinone biosynthesis methyltransferase, partial [bacterium]